jgi:hypothetical protein
MGKSLDEIYRQIQKQQAERRSSEMLAEQKRAQIAEQQRKEWLERNRLYEKAFNPSAAASSSAGAGGGSKPQIPYWETVTGFAYLYPKSDLMDALAVTNVQYTNEGNRYIFANLVDLDLFYYDVWYRTSLSQPLGNLSFSLVPGTQLEGSFDEVHLDLQDGTRIITWQLMKQLTPQAELNPGFPPGGDSPNGTIGYGAIYSDADGDGIPGTITESGIGNIDPLRFQRTN